VRLPPHLPPPGLSHRPHHRSGCPTTHETHQRGHPARHPQTHRDQAPSPDPQEQRGEDLRLPEGQVGVEEE